MDFFFYEWDVKDQFYRVIDATRTMDTNLMSDRIKDAVSELKEWERTHGRDIYSEADLDLSTEGVQFERPTRGVRKVKLEEDGTVKQEPANDDGEHAAKAPKREPTKREMDASPNKEQTFMDAPLGL